MKTCALTAALTVMTVNICFADTFNSTISDADLPEHKITPLSNYISSTEALRVLTEEPNILFLDVRDPVEIALSGRPMQVDAVVPIRIQTEDFDTDLSEYKLADNPYFLENMSEVMHSFGKSKHDMIIVTCGSGYRSAQAVRKLVSAGYTNVWHVPDGYPGEEKPGMNSGNAWRLAGLPWTYEPVHGSEWQKLLTE